MGTVSSFAQHNSIKGCRHRARTVCSLEPYPVNLYSFPAQLQAWWTTRVLVTYHSMVPLFRHISEGRGTSLGIRWAAESPNSFSFYQELAGMGDGRTWNLCGSDGGVRRCARTLHAVEGISCMLHGCITCQLKSLWHMEIEVGQLGERKDSGIESG